MAAGTLFRLAIDCPDPREAFFAQWPGPAVLVDDRGEIVAVNEEWRSEQADPATMGLGANYLDECRAAVRRGCHDAGMVAAGLEDVLAGRRQRFRTVHGCAVGGSQRWHEVTIWKLRTRSFRGAAIVRDDVTDSYEAQRRTYALANADPLTGLANRRALATAIDDLAGGDRQGIFAILDLDGFKAINDRYGHDLGDRVLMILARRLKHAVRSSDTVARIGGDEFALLLGGGREAKGRLDAIADSVRAPIRLDQTTVSVDVSYGWVPLIPGEVSLHRLYRAADQAMYRMKATRQAARSGKHIVQPSADA